MLSISKKCKYGVLASLVLAETYGRGLLQIKDIASRKNIPRQYLEQIFNRLGSAGIVKSVRGKKGGYELAQPPERIKVIDIIEVLEGGISLSTDLPENIDAVSELFLSAEERLKSSLSINLSELSLRQQALRSQIMYHI